jgi:hypothetical protein
MDIFGFYLDLGFWHVIDWQGLDHFFFIITLALPFTFAESKKLIWWVTLFTLGHTLSLVGNFYAEIPFSSYWIELLIPITIGLSAASLLWQKSTFFFSHRFFFPLITVLFGGIHGLGFGRYFGMLVPEDAVTLSLFSFALGVEFAQLVIVLIVLFANWMVIDFLKQTKFYWKFLIGAMILSQAISMILERI